MGPSPSLDAYSGRTAETDLLPRLFGDTSERARVYTLDLLRRDDSL